ncbi:hypothetical protein C1H46_041278 [Malus baccata]|uniref:Uncharacterized protein n=1 Tax=Malus baccata TaxID=106549 RepID=A0A540KGA9_MALBA|nr:hypothetical protein C1H46_041278 [Malus baccata]
MAVYTNIILMSLQSTQWNTFEWRLYGCPQKTGATLKRNNRHNVGCDNGDDRRSLMVARK